MPTNMLARRRQAAMGGAMAAAGAAKSAYDDLINLTIGDFDVPTPDGIVQQACADGLAGHTKYANSQGDPELRQEICNFYREDYGISITPEEVFVSAGGCMAMYLSLLAILDEGDEVIVPEPYFCPYVDQITLAGGVPVFLPTYAEENWQVMVERIEPLLTPRTRAILINTPNNPTGACMNKAKLEEIGRFAKAHGLLVVADDIYTSYSYQEPFYPIRALEGMEDTVITINSFSKTFVLTGLRVGNIIAPEPVIRAIRSLNEGMVYSAPSLSQRAALYALRNRAQLVPPLVEEFRARAELACALANALPGMSAQMPEGTIYLFPCIKETGLSSAEVCRLLLEEAHVRALPGGEFGSTGEGYLRLALTVDQEKLREAFARMAKMPIFQENTR